MRYTPVTEHACSRTSQHLTCPDTWEKGRRSPSPAADNCTAPPNSTRQISQSIEKWCSKFWTIPSEFGSIRKHIIFSASEKYIFLGKYLFSWHISCLNTENQYRHFVVGTNEKRLLPPAGQSEATFTSGPIGAPLWVKPSRHVNFTSLSVQSLPKKVTFSPLS